MRSSGRFRKARPKTQSRVLPQVFTVETAGWSRKTKVRALTLKKTAATEPYAQERLKMLLSRNSTAMSCGKPETPVMFKWPPPDPGGSRNQVDWRLGAAAGVSPWNTVARSPGYKNHAESQHYVGIGCKPH